MAVTHYILCAVIIFASALLQGLSGFGFSLLALPLIAFLLPLKVVVPMFTLFSLVLNIMVLASSWRGLHLRRILPLILAGAISVPLGAYLLKVVDAEVLRIWIGLVVIIASICLASGYRVRLKDERLGMIPVGIASGVLSGSITFGGPPVIIFLANQQVDKLAFRANITAYFMTLNLVGIPTYAASGLITRGILLNSLYLSPALVLGTLAGIFLSGRVREESFRRLVLILIAILGVLSLATGLNDLVRKSGGDQSQVLLDLRPVRHAGLSARL